MKMCFDEFIYTFPTSTEVSESKSARFIYDSIIWDDQVRISFAKASNDGLPALSVCAKRIEDYCINTPDNDLDLTDITVKQSLGRMIDVSLYPLGYTSNSNEPMPKNLNLKFFKNAETYQYTGK